MRKSAKKTIVIDVAILIVVAIVLAVSMAWSTDIELKLGLLYYTDEPVDESEIVVIENKNGVRVSAADGSGELNVHFVDVGQGDCTLIELPDGKTMIIDGANRFERHTTAVMNYLEKTLPADFKYFDYAILTHADADHCGSLDDVLNMYPAYVVYRPNVKSTYSGYTDPGADDLLPYFGTTTTAAYKDFLVSAYAPNDDFTPQVIVTDATDDSQTITGGDGDDAYSLTFYSPLYAGNKSYSDANDYSSIMILEYRGIKFALSGDAEKTNEREFAAKVEAAKTDGVTDKYDAFTDSYCVNVIKNGHHGSSTSSTQEYLDAITTPSGVSSVYFVMSCNAADGNNYGHPHAETLERIAAMGVPEQNILRTDLLGDITLSVRMDEDGEFKLFYGATASDSPEPDDTNDPIGDDEEPPQICIYPTVLVYRKIGNIKLKWAVVAWTAYAVLVAIAVVHMIYIANFTDASASGRGNGNGKGKSKGKSRK